MVEDKNFKNRNMLVLLFEVIIIIIAIGGLTFATTELINGTSTIVTFGEYNVDYVGETDLVVSNLEPISDSMINYDTKDNVVRLEFSLKGVDTNKDDNLIYDIMLSDLNIDCSLLNEYTKWNLYKNGELLSNGNFSPEFDGNVLTDNMRLTQIQQDLPKYNEEYDNYVLIIWISESCEDLSNCKLIDQSQIVDSVMDMNVFVALLSGEKVKYVRVPSTSKICVNKPELYSGMIPVYYKDGDWLVADKTNSDVNRLWYNYEDSNWANAVFVNNNKYNDSKPGTKVMASDIVSYYVWIPRFKYKLWNAEEIVTDSYDAYNKGIDIVFESGTHSTGIVKCKDSLCPGSNDKYITHKAFGEDLRGFWVNKYEISDGGKSLPMVSSLVNMTLDEYKNIVSGLVNIYGIDDVAESHIISNLEWGAISYLSHSKYGLCKNNKCDYIGVNDTLISEKNKQDTTTRNVYGVYDMAGAGAEYAVGELNVGSAYLEVRINSNETWNKGVIFENYKDYILRGGINNGIFTTSDIGMKDVASRGVLVSK